MKTWMAVFWLALVGVGFAEARIFARLLNPAGGGGLTYVGDSLAEEFPGQQGWFEVETVAFGMENPVSIGSTSGGAGAGKATPLPVTLVKPPNSVSAAMFTACAMGAHWDTMEIVFTRATGMAGLVPYLRLELKMVYVESLSIDGASSEGGLEEAVTLRYGAHRISFYGLNAKGMMDLIGQTVWSFVLNKAAFDVGS